MRSVTTIIAAAAVALGTVQAALADRVPPSWRVVDLSGVVSLSSKGGCRPIETNAELPAAAMLTTLADGRITLKRGSESIVLSPLTRLTVTARAGNETRVVQETGMAWFKVQKKHAPHFSVETPSLTATVRGTTFTVAVDALGAAVHVREGAVEVATDWRDAVTLVRAGTMARVVRAKSDRIELINGGNVMHVVTRNDGAGPMGLRRGGGVAGALFASDMRRSAPRGPAAIRVGTADLRLSGFGAAARTDVSRYGAVAQRVEEPVGVAAPPRRSSLRRAAFDLPLLETALGALILLLLITTHTVLGSVRQARVREQASAE